MDGPLCLKLFGLETGFVLNAVCILLVNFIGGLDEQGNDHNAALGLVVPEMAKRGYVRFECGVDSFAWATFRKRLGYPGSGYGSGKELPSAICEAALAALDAEEAQG